MNDELQCTTSFQYNLNIFKHNLFLTPFNDCQIVEFQLSPVNCAAQESNFKAAED